jgi:predicted metal-dependent RNase
MRLTLFNSGHILGSSVAHVHVGEGLHNILYTSDTKFDRTALYEPASTEFQRAETVIIESTYGSAQDVQPKRSDVEARLVEICRQVTDRGGKVLIPSFAVERSQDVMVILEKAGFEKTVYLDGMVWDATAIHTTYPEYMSREIQKLVLQQGKNPFTSPILKRLGSQEEREKVLKSKEPCVIIASSGMLIGGPSVWWLQRLADEEKNALIFVGYQAEGTMGRRIQKGWKEVPMTEKGKTRAVPVNCQIETIDGLSGHSDIKQLQNYVARLKQIPERIIVNHGEASKCIELSRILHKLLRCETTAPKNLETIRLK